MTPRRWIP